MMYRAYEKDGKFYVAKGKKFWPATAYNTKEEAIEAGLCREANELYQRSQKAFAELVKRFPDKYSDDFQDRASKCSYADLIC